MARGISQEKPTVASGGRLVRTEISGALPLIPADDFVLFPHNSSTLHEIDALASSDIRLAYEGKLHIAVVGREKDSGNRGTGRLAKIGTEAVISHIVRTPTGQLAAVIRGIRRFRVDKISQSGKRKIALVTFIPDGPVRATTSHLAAVKVIRNLIVRFAQQSDVIGQELLSRITTCHDGSVLCDLIIPQLTLSFAEKIDLLHDSDVQKRMRAVNVLLRRELNLVKLSNQIRHKVKDEIDEIQRRQFLTHQLKAIKSELNEIDGIAADEIEELESAFSEIDLPISARSAVKQELDKLAGMPAGSPDYVVSFGYLNWLKEMPWHGKENKGVTRYPKISRAKIQLDRDHFGLDKVKERILDHLAVVSHKKKVAGQNLLLFGPPGVGKTSLAESIAKALGRPLARISLGGVKDEAEIRGHRRTYVGAMPGKIIQAIKQANSSSPVILLDEIDKLGREAGGGVEAALLEVVDPEQNRNFGDHFLNVPFDLSNVLFIATANDIDAISDPLKDRFEAVEVSSYTDAEKVAIARIHLIPKLRSELKLKNQEFSIDDEAVFGICRDYNREAGVRGLQRDLTTIGRKVVRRKMEGRFRGIKIKKSGLAQWLGRSRYIDEVLDVQLIPGVAVGLAYTSVGGEILYIESMSRFDESSRGRLNLTGSLGKVMQESAQTALTFLTGNASRLGISCHDLSKSEIHLHIPDGATPKDGPSAGLAIMFSLASLFLKRAIPGDVAVTGEVTLRGQVMPVGGIREKLLAAHRNRKSRIIIPRQNLADLEEIPKDVLAQLEIIPVDTMIQALEEVGLLGIQ